MEFFRDIHFRDWFRDFFVDISPHAYTSMLLSEHLFSYRLRATAELYDPYLLFLRSWIEMTIFSSEVKCAFPHTCNFRKILGWKDPAKHLDVCHLTDHRHVT